MAPTRYTTKVRAKRIGIEYFKRPHPFRRWKLILSVAAPAMAALWVGVAAVQKDQRIYTSGSVSTAHAMFGTQCSDCHVPATAVPTAERPGAPADGQFFLRPTDKACLACHDGPVHHEQQVFTPGCASCHVEHKGRIQLAALGDPHCVQCHTDLRTKEPGALHFAQKIRGFSAGHPEFALDLKQDGRIVRVRLDQKAQLRDHAQIKLNHKKHLKVGLKGLEELRALHGPRSLIERKGGLQLACSFCHQTDDAGAFMRPISYAKHCGPGCHPLDVDARLPDAVAPHDKPAIVHAYLRTLYLEAFEQCQALPKTPKGREADGGKLRKQCQDLELISAPPTEESSSDRPRGARLGASEPTREAAEERPRGARLGRSEEAEEAQAGDQPRSGPMSRGELTEEPATDRPRGLRGRSQSPEEGPVVPRSGSALEWASAEFHGAEKTMMKQQCAFCHTVTFPADRLPEVAPTAIPARWLPHSRFDHSVHRPIACTECHKALISQETEDVLLPSMKTCQECHQESGGARTQCVECHGYHDKTKERDPGGSFAVRQLVTGPSRAASGSGLLRRLIPASGFGSR